MGGAACRCKKRGGGEGRGIQEPAVHVYHRQSDRSIDGALLVELLVAAICIFIYIYAVCSILYPESVAANIALALASPLPSGSSLQPWRHSLP